MFLEVQIPKGLASGDASLVDSITFPASGELVRLFRLIGT
jgi:hypothetical protein